MTHHATGTIVPTAAATSAPLPIKRDAHGENPPTAGRSIRRAIQFVFDVSAEASQLRRSLHRRYPVLQE